MVTLPNRSHTFYAGIDPGFTGAIAIMNDSGTSMRVYDMPTTSKGRDRTRELDMEGLQFIFRKLKLRPDIVLGIEWPTTRPGEGAERCERFGRQKGILHAYAHLLGLDYYLIAPQLWKGRLDVPGKTEAESGKRVAALFESLYPDFADYIRGPRGGLKDGRLDALLIAHFLRTHTQKMDGRLSGNFNLDNPDALEAMFGSKKRGKKRKDGLI